jgi:hypothetical protein
MEKMYLLTDEAVIKKAKRIWVTELDGCTRQQEYRITGAPALGPHYTQLRGTLTHRVTESVLQDNPVDLEKLDYSEIPEAKDHLMEELSGFEARIRQWKEKTKIDLSQARYSEKFELPLRDGFVLVGEKDCTTPTHIIDFKSGVKKNTMEYRIQLAAYNEYQKIVDGERTLTNVFFGDEEAVEFNPFDNPKTPYAETRSVLEGLIDQAVRNRELIMNGFHMPCKMGMLCAFCRSRAICNGY